MFLKRSLIISILLIASGCGFLFYRMNPSQKASIHECDNIFSSDVYTEFQQQLTAFVENDLATHPFLKSEHPKLVQFVTLLLEPQSKDLRYYHTSWLTSLRTQLNLLGEQPSDELNRFFLRLDHWLMTSPDLTKSIENFLFTKFALPKYKEDYASVIHSYHHQILHSSPNFYSFKAPAYDDGYLYGNIPSYLFSLNNPKKTKVLRMANFAKDLPLVKSLFLPPKDGIQPEFVQYIEQLGDGKHLYVNLMKRKGKESRKTQQLENFEATQASLILVSLDKDSTFYWQARNYANLNDAERFKTAFHQNLFRKSGNYYWSNKIDLNAWAKDSREILDEVHRKYFSSRPFLSVKERTDFIELSYIAMIDRLVLKFEPECLNISCKHSMDRGPSLTTLFYVGELFKQGKGLFLGHPKIITMLFSPPLLVHNRRSHTSRIDRFASALERMQKVN